MDKHSYIAVFDSGVGGVSVLRELRALMPGERFYYFGDSANAPYGKKTTEKVRELTLAAGKKLLEDLGCKALAVLSSCGAFLLINFSLSYIQAGKVLIFNNFTTAISVLAGIFIMGDTFTWVQVVGILLIIGGVFGVSYQKPAEAVSEGANS